MSEARGTRVVRWLGKAAMGLLLLGAIALGYQVILAPRAPLASPLAASVAHAAVPFTVDGVLETDEVDVAAKLPGRLAAVLVDEGDTVHAGQTVALLEADELAAKRDQGEAGVRAAQTQVDQGELAVTLEGRKAEDQCRQAQAGVQAARAGLGMAQAKLAALEHGARPQEVTQAEQGVAAAQAVYDTAAKTYTRVKGLAEEGVLAQQKADEAEMGYRSAAAQLAAAKAKLDLVKDGARVEEIAAARDQVRQAEAGIAAAEGTRRLAEDGRLMVDIRRKDVLAARQKVAAGVGVVREVAAYQRQTRILAPLDGRVTQRMSRAGEIIAPGYAILTIARASGYWVKVTVDESAFAGHSVGEAVTVQVPALGHSVPGHIRRVLSAADFATKRTTGERGTFDTRAVDLRVTLDTPLVNLATGMTARVAFR